MASNISLHYKIAQFVKEEMEFSAAETEDLLAELNYLLFDITQQATIYKTILEMDFPDCREFDYYQWERTAK